jgi:hypothetical protein
MKSLNHFLVRDSYSRFYVRKARQNLFSEPRFVAFFTVQRRVRIWNAWRRQGKISIRGQGSLDRIADGKVRLPQHLLGDLYADRTINASNQSGHGFLCSYGNANPDWR